MTLIIYENTICYLPRVAAISTSLLKSRDNSQFIQTICRLGVMFFYGSQRNRFLRKCTVIGAGTVSQSSVYSQKYTFEVIVFVSISRQIGHVNSVERIFVFITMRRPWTRGTTLRVWKYTEWTRVNHYSRHRMDL